jgi:hypothetical protein
MQISRDVADQEKQREDARIWIAKKRRVAGVTAPGWPRGLGRRDPKLCRIACGEPVGRSRWSSDRPFSFFTARPSQMQLQRHQPQAAGFRIGQVDACEGCQARPVGCLRSNPAIRLNARHHQLCVADGWISLPTLTGFVTREGGVASLPARLLETSRTVA